MYLECTCADISKYEWDRKMKSAKPINYKWLCNKIKKNLPELYNACSLDLYNPWMNQAAVTKTHYILVWSSIEYFIHK